MTTLSKAFVSLLFLVTVASATMALRSGGLTEFTDTLPTLYITGLLAVGVLRDVTDTRRWQLALFGGLTLVMLTEYAATRELFDLLVMLGSAAMVIGLAFDAFPE